MFPTALYGAAISAANQIRERDYGDRKVHDDRIGHHQHPFDDYDRQEEFDRKYASWILQFNIVVFIVIVAMMIWCEFNM